MKTKNKALLLALCAVLLVAASVLGTMAYLTSQAQVVNTFTVGAVKITLDEAQVDLYGEVVGDSRVMQNEYKLMPGHTYHKDPTVHVTAGSEDCWVFVKITNEIADIEADETIDAQMERLGWVLIDDNNGVYAYPTIAKAGTDLKVFESFTITSEITGDTLATYADKTITVVAYAVQADGFATAEAAWTAAFAGQG